MFVTESGFLPRDSILDFFVDFKPHLCICVCWPRTPSLLSADPSANWRLTFFEGVKVKDDLKKLMRTPSLILEERLRREVEECISEDKDCSPHMDRVRRGLGAEYEFILQQKLRARYAEGMATVPPRPRQAQTGVRWYRSGFKPNSPQWNSLACCGLQYS